MGWKIVGVRESLMALSSNLSVVIRVFLRPVARWGRCGSRHRRFYLLSDGAWLKEGEHPRYIGQQGSHVHLRRSEYQASTSPLSWMCLYFICQDRESLRFRAIQIPAGLLRFLGSKESSQS